MGVTGTPTLSWRVGSDRDGACQATCRVRVTSMADGTTCWDSGTIRTGNNEVRYAGTNPGAGVPCVWFVTLTDDQGELAYSAPASFTWGEPGDVARSPLHPPCEGCLWASGFPEGVVPPDGVVLADDPRWKTLLGLAGVVGDRMRIALPTWDAGVEDVCFVQGSMLLSRGLLVLRWERAASQWCLLVTVPVGMTAEVELASGVRVLGSGRHVLDCVSTNGCPPGKRYP